MKVQNKTHNLSFFNPPCLGINPILLEREPYYNFFLYFKGKVPSFITEQRMFIRKPESSG
jgi:hypothetical protein